VHLSKALKLLPHSHYVIYTSPELRVNEYLKKARGRECFQSYILPLKKKIYMLRMVVEMISTHSSN